VKLRSHIKPGEKSKLGFTALVQLVKPGAVKTKEAVAIKPTRSRAKEY